VEAVAETRGESPSGDLKSLRRDFHGKLETLRGQLVPELRSRRRDLIATLSATDSRVHQLQQICAEAERDGREEFEALRGHLSSVESLKSAVLRRERDIRSGLVDGIDDILRRVQLAESGLDNAEAMAAFVKEYPELRAGAETLVSRSASLPRVDVSLDDIPFEARARSEKLRKFAVMGRLQRAKDVCIWRLEKQRRQLANEAQEIAAWMQHFEVLLNRYADEFAYTCYFCAERFSASAANTRCVYNLGVSPRTGRAIAPDPRALSHLWGAGVHFWVPQHAQQQQGMAAAGARPPGHEWLSFPRSPVVAHWPRGLSDEQQLDTASGASAPLSRHSTPPRAMPTSWDVPPAAVAPGALHAAAVQPAAVPPQTSQPGSEAFPRASPFCRVAGQVDWQLRRIAQACEQRGLDIRAAFRAFDTNGDGLISPHEFRHALEQLGLGLSSEETGWLAGRLDANADGMLSYEEFLTQLFRSARDPSVAQVGAAFVDHFSNHDPAARSLWQRVAKAFRDRGVPLRQVFALFDADGDGVISRQELVEAFRLMRLGLEDDDVERLMRDIDQNEDGKVNIQEFVNRLQ